ESRISACGKGAAAVLANKAVAMIAPSGKKAASWRVRGDYVNDIACHPELKQVYATGFDNKRGTPPGQKNYPVQVAFIYAYAFTGKQAWKGYGWKGQEVADLKLMADTRGYRLTVAGDKLYVAGESAGGNTMWGRMSDDLDTKADLTKSDAFQSAHNTAANHITFVGRLDAKTGKTEAGSMLLARLDSGKGNTIRPRALAALDDGRVFVGGASASDPPISKGAYGKQFSGGGAFFCAFDKDFDRFFATKFCQGSTLGIAVKGSTFVAVGKGTAHLLSRNEFMKADHHERTKEAPDGWAVVLVKSIADTKKAAARLDSADSKRDSKPRTDKPATSSDGDPKPKPRPKPRPKANSAKDLALAKLKVAKAYLNMGRWKMAHEELQELLDKYPDSKHAPEARKLLEKLKDRFR
ncbi:MAG: tetratricopeptide repeat protein, partial [Phycisphaerae bacterium]